MGWHRPAPSVPEPVAELEVDLVHGEFDDLRWIERIRAADLFCRRVHQRHRPAVAAGQFAAVAGGEMLLDDDIHLCVPAERTARIQETHLVAIHCLCDGIDALLLGVE